jgi:hypothetical protein
MAKQDITIVEIQFPDPPKVSERPDKQQDFERWYEQFKACMVRQFEDLAAVIDANKKS